ncbi:MAG: DUF6884 domain-containing protein [Ilyomonas sp.]
MKTIVLISCASRKLNNRSKAKDLYQGPIFKNSLAYAEKLNPDKIFILSALHGLLPLNKEIDPYNVTLSKISKSKQKPGLTVLNPQEKIEWGKKVVQQLSQEADLKNDKFVILAGQEYIKPISDSIVYYEDVLHGLGLFKIVRFLKQKMQ